MSVAYLVAHPHRNKGFGYTKRREASNRDDDRTAIELRDSLAREGSLHRQLDELVRHDAVLSELLGDAHDAASRTAVLTPREREVMQRIVAGEPNKNIAADLGISRRTVENHRAGIMKKTGAKSLPALARLALAAAWSRAPASEPPKPRGR